jgi:hypothetical protein
MTKVSKEVYIARRKAWTNDLRSGKFKQTDGVLHSRDKSRHHKYCCLGVALKGIDIEFAIRVETNTLTEVSTYSYDSKSGDLPQVAQDYFGFEGSSGDLRYTFNDCKDVIAVDGKMVIVDRLAEDHPGYYDRYSIKSLATANDDHKISFVEIANFVDNHPEWLFKKGTY